MAHNRMQIEAEEERFRLTSGLLEAQRQAEEADQQVGTAGTVTDNAKQCTRYGQHLITGPTSVSNSNLTLGCRVQLLLAQGDVLKKDSTIDEVRAVGN